MGFRDATTRALGSVLRKIGEPATLSFAGELPAAATGVFEASYELVTLDSGLPVSTIVPVCLVRLSECPRRPARGDEVIVSAGTYRVRDVQPDGQGGALLVLEQ